MNRRAQFGLLLTCAVASCNRPSRPGSTLAGTWTPVSAELGGQDFPVASFGGANLQLTGDTYEFAGDKGTYAVVSGNPANMDIKGREGPNAGRTILAIYKLDGDRVTICYQLGSGERPNEFVSPKGSQVLLVHYKRSSPSAVR